MRLAFTSDIHIDQNGPEALDALAERVRELSPDVLLVAGDIASGARTWLGTVVTLRPLVPELLLVAGNHDVWSAPSALEAGANAWTWLDRILPALAREAGAHLLDAAPVTLGGYGFAGTLGWFDLTTRDPELDAPMSAYRLGVWGGLRWNDHRYAIWTGDDGRELPCESVAECLRERLRGHLAALDAPRVVVATHMLPFAAQVRPSQDPGWRFTNAFMGSLPLGEAIASDRRVSLAISGHTHRASDLQMDRLRAVTSPLGYRREWGGATAREAVARSVTVVDLPETST